MAFLDRMHTTETSTNEHTARQDARSSYKKSKNPNRCSCGKAIDSDNIKHTMCKECFGKQKTKDCECGEKILPSKKCCYKCSKKKKEKSESKQTNDEEEPTQFTLDAKYDTVDTRSNEELKSERTWARQVDRKQKGELHSRVPSGERSR